MKRQQFSTSCLGFLAGLCATGSSCTPAAEPQASTKSKQEAGPGLSVFVAKWVVQDGQVLFKMDEDKISPSTIWGRLCWKPKGTSLQKPALIFGRDCGTYDELLLLDSVSAKLLAAAGFDPPGDILSREQFQAGFYILYWSEYSHPCTAKRGLQSAILKST